jgi:hypothetical protein
MGSWFDADRRRSHRHPERHERRGIATAARAGRRLPGRRLPGLPARARHAFADGCLHRRHSTSIDRRPHVRHRPLRRSFARLRFMYARIHARL